MKGVFSLYNTHTGVIQGEKGVGEELCGIYLSLPHPLPSSLLLYPFHFSGFSSSPPLYASVLLPPFIFLSAFSSTFLPSSPATFISSQFFYPSFFFSSLLPFLPLLPVRLSSIRTQGNLRIFPLTRIVTVSPLRKRYGACGVLSLYLTQTSLLLAKQLVIAGPACCQR